MGYKRIRRGIADAHVDDVTKFEIREEVMEVLELRKVLMEADDIFVEASHRRRRT